MSRPKKIRTISSIPSLSGFKPYGLNIKNPNNEAVFLLCEEYETLRLNDYEKCNQVQGAIIMKVSRPTYTRIYLSAREKIAKAFIEGRQIIIEGGKVEFNQDWYYCNDCNASFNIIDDIETTCPLCNRNNTIEYTQEINSIDINTLKNSKIEYGRNRCRMGRNNNSE